ncbi:hypothetical protein IAT38_001970 [Cryptococcus sp. DSM 104549]
MVRTVREPNPTTPQILRTSISRSTPHHSPSRPPSAKPRPVLGERNDNSQPRPATTTKSGHFKPTTSPSRSSLSRFIAKSPRRVHIPSSSPMPRLASSPSGSPRNASTSTARLGSSSYRPRDSVIMPRYKSGQDETLLMDMEMPGMSMAFDTTDESGAETDTDGPGALPSRVRGGLMTPAPSQEVRLQNPSTSRPRQTAKRPRPSPAASTALRPAHSHTRMPTPPASQNPAVTAELDYQGDLRASTSSAAGKRVRPRVSTTATPPRRLAASTSQIRPAPSPSPASSVAAEPSPNPRRRKTPRLSDERASASRSPETTPRAEAAGKGKGRKGKGRVSFVALPTAEPDEETMDAEEETNAGRTPAPAPRARTAAPPATAPAAKRRRRKSIVMPRTSRKRSLASRELLSKSQTASTSAPLQAVSSQTPKPAPKLSASTTTTAKAPKSRRASTTATLKTPGRRRTSALSTEFTAHLEAKRNMSTRIYDKALPRSSTSDSEDILMIRGGDDSSEEDQELVMRGERWERATRDTMRKVTDRALGWRPPTVRKLKIKQAPRDPDSGEEEDEDAPFEGYDAPVWSDDGSDREGEGVGEDTFVGVKGRRAGLGLGMGLGVASGSGSGLGLTRHQQTEEEEDEDEEDEAGPSGISGEALAAASPYIPPRRSAVTFSMSPASRPPARMISRSPALSMAGRLSSVGRHSSPVLAPSPGGFASSSPFAGADDLPEEEQEEEEEGEEGGEGGADADVTVEGQQGDWEQEDWEGWQDEQPAMVFDPEDTFVPVQVQQAEEVGEEREAGVEDELEAEKDEQEEAAVELDAALSPAPAPSFAPIPRTTPTPSPSPSSAPDPAQSPLPLANSTATTTSTSRFAFTQQIRSPTPPRPYAPEREAAALRVSTPFVLIRNREEVGGYEGVDAGVDDASERFEASSDVGEENVGDMDAAAEAASEHMSASEDEDDAEQSQDEILQRASRLVSRLSVPLDFTVPTSFDDTSRTTAIATPTRLVAPVSPTSSLASRVSHVSHESPISHVSHESPISHALRSASCTPAPEVKIEAASPIAESTPRAADEREISRSPTGRTPSASPRGLSPALGGERMSLSRSPSASPRPRERTLTPEMPARESLSPGHTPRARDFALPPAVESPHPSPRGKTPTPSPRPEEREVTPFLAPPESVRSARTPSGSPQMGMGLLAPILGMPGADERERESTPIAEGRTLLASQARTPSRSPAPAQTAMSPGPADSPSSRTRSRSRSYASALPPAPAGTFTPAFSPVKVESTTPAGSPMQTRSRALTPGTTEMGQLGVPVLTPRRGNSAPASPMGGRTPVAIRDEEPERVKEDVEVPVEVEENVPLLPEVDAPSPQKEAPSTTDVDSHMEAAVDSDEADAQEIDASFFEAHIPSQTLLQPSLSPFAFSGSSSEQEREQSARTPSRSPAAFSAARPEGFRESPSPALPRRKSISLPFAEQGDDTPGQQGAMVDDEFGGDVTVDGESGAWDLSGEGEHSRGTARGRDEEGDEDESGDEEMGERSGGEEDEGEEGEEGEEDERDEGEEEEDAGNEKVEEAKKKEVGEKIIIKLVDIGILKVEPDLEGEEISVESAQVNEGTSLESAQAEDDEEELQGDSQRSLAAELSPDSDAHRSPSPPPAEAPATPAQASTTPPAGPTTPLVYPSLAHIPSPLFLAPAAPPTATVSTSSAFRVEQFFPAPATSSADAPSSVIAPQRGHASASGSSTSHSVLENMLAKRQAPHSKLSQQVLPSSSPAPSHHVDEEEETEDPVRSDTEVSPEPEADRSVRVRKPRKSLRDELAAAMCDGDESFGSVVEVTSLDPRAAARAAAILRLNHEYIERGILPSSQDPNASSSSMRKSISRIDKRELLHEAELELVAQRRSRSISTSRASDAGEWVNPARDDLEREMRQAREASVMTFRTEDYPVPGGYMKTPGTAKRLRSQHRGHRARASHADDSRTPTAKSKGKGKERAGASGKDKSAWGVAEWKRLEKVYRAEKEAWIKEREVKSLPRSPVAAAPGTPGTPAMPGGLVSWARRATMSFGTPTKPKAGVSEVKAKEWDGERVVERFLREEGGAGGRGEEWDSEVILLRVHAIERRINRLRQKEGGSTDLETPAPKRARTSPKAKRPTAADETFEGHSTMLQTPFVGNVPGGVEPPSTIRRVLGFVWGKKAAVPELPAQAEAKEAEGHDKEVVERDEETAGVREKGKGLMREFEAVREKDMREVQTAVPKPVSAPAPLKPTSRPASIPIPLPTPAPTASALTASTSSSYTYSHSTSSYSYPISSMYTPLSGTRLYPPLDPPLTQRSSAIAKLFPGGVKTTGPPPPQDKGKGKEIEGSMQKSRSGSVKDLAKAFEGK